MDHYREIKNNLVWHNEGKFEAELVNGVITKLNFCEPGKGPQDEGKSLTSINFKYLQAVHASLGELFTFIEQENQRLGYSFARPAEIEPSQEEKDRDTQNMLETKLRSLVKYEDQHGAESISIDNNRLRDIG